MWYFHIWNITTIDHDFVKNVKFALKKFRLKVQHLKWFYNIFHGITAYLTKKYFNSIFILPWIFFRIYFCLKFREIKYLFFNFLKMFGCLAMVYAIQFVKHFTLCVTAIFWLSNRLENISDSLVLLGGAGLSRPGRC